ncbi:uncharacterized protein LOC129960190 isoform X2 [Argiope bruennichi]|uniref:uncharacterized protein LOC129960190 isoform X2 n=1 Tax=Argiope bruennichi TaxID=94029 RepID=UPI00249491A0|nr:uncharacterized protein LOC129960190 isoform X2 [Argiope bruennichi]
MVSLQTVILCISIAFFGLTFPESEAKTYDFTIPPGEDLSDVDLSKLNLGKNVDKSKVKLNRHTVPGVGTNHTYRYKTPGKTVTHTYRYKKPGKTNIHHYRYKKPGQTDVHHYRYKKPGMTDVHHYQYKKPGQTNIHNHPMTTTPAPVPQKPVTGVYYMSEYIIIYFLCF